MIMKEMRESDMRGNLRKTERGNGRLYERVKISMGGARER